MSDKFRVVESEEFDDSMDCFRPVYYIEQLCIYKTGWLWKRKTITEWKLLPSFFNIGTNLVPTGYRRKFYHLDDAIKQCDIYNNKEPLKVVYE